MRNLKTISQSSSFEVGILMMLHQLVHDYLESASMIPVKKAFLHHENIRAPDGSSDWPPAMHEGRVIL
ncbi:hypothetical protein ACFX2J_006165 [Malus domestica]|uniref:Uncharacterized protein n=1 Tax=Malus baccata TaxID=106549 RepID=A0A540KAL0_MALBA|nr:hypothetical protein C1H46_043199 [Malus baccata]